MMRLAVSLLLALLSFSASAAVGYGGTGSGSVIGNTLTFDVDAGTGSDRVLYAGFRCPANRTVTSITYGGNAMTLVGSSNATNILRVYRLVNPPTGTNSFSVTTNGGADTMRGVAVVATGVNTSDPDDTPVAQEVLDVTADQSTNVSTETGDSVLSTAVVLHSSAGGTITSLNTSLVEIDNATASAGMSHGENAATVSAGWSFTGDGSGGADFWQVAFNINQTGGGGGGGSGLLRRRR